MFFDYLKLVMFELGKFLGYKYIFFDGEGIVGLFNQFVFVLCKKNVQVIGVIYYVFDFFLLEWWVQVKFKEYVKIGMKLKECLVIFVVLFKNDCSEDYV